MKWNQFESWQSTVLNHWAPVIDQTLDEVANQPWQIPYDPTADKAALKTQAQNHLASIETALENYRTDITRLGPFIDCLLSQLFYVQLAFVAPSPVAPVSTPAAIPDNDLRNLFAWWSQNLPSPSSLFKVHYNGGTAMPVYTPLAEPPVVSVTGTFSLVTTSVFTTAIETINTAAQSDIARMKQLPEQVQAVTRERVAYGIFAGKDAVIEPTDIDAKSHLLGPMHTQAILDTFGWTIKGLNA